MHPLAAEEAPEDLADVTQIREWRNELAHGVAWDAAHAAGTSESLGFINNHLVAGGQLPLTRTGNSGFHRRKDATDARTQSQ